MRTVEHELSAPQGRVFRDESRFQVVVAGRRFGKSMLGVHRAAKSAVRKSKANVWYIAPTFDDAYDFAWEPLQQIIPREYLASRPHETRLEMRLVNGSVIRLRSADRPDRLRGRGLDDVVLDEFRWIEPRTWPEILRPALADREGRALFISTPKGYDWVYEMWRKGQEGAPGWASWRFTTREGTWVSEDEMAAVASETDERTFRQEYEASFETSEGRVYYPFDRNVHVDDAVQDTGAELYIGQDFNVHPMASAVAVKVANEFHFIDAFELPISNTEELVAEVKVRYPDRTVIFCPDPSGKQRRTSAPVGQTDFTIIKNAGFQIHAPNAAPPIVDRINNTNANLRAVDGTVRVKFHPRAVKLIRGYEGLCYKEGTSQPDKKQKDIAGTEIIHICDAADYLLWQESNLVEKKRTVTKTRFVI
jgi:hypothetical protein